MTPIQTMSILVRLSALSLGVLIASRLGRSISSQLYDPIDILFSLFVAYGAVRSFSSPTQLAKILLHGIDDSDSSTAKGDPNSWYEVGRSLIGLWLVASSLPQLFFAVVLAVTDTPTNSVQLTQSLITISIGVALLAGWPKLKTTL